MIAQKLIMPFGYFEVLRNSRNIGFSAEEGSSSLYYFGLIAITDETDGLVFRIIDDPKKYLCYKDSRYYPDRTVISSRME